MGPSVHQHRTALSNQALRDRVTHSGAARGVTVGKGREVLMDGWPMSPPYRCGDPLRRPDPDVADGEQPVCRRLGGRRGRCAAAPGGTATSVSTNPSILAACWHRFPDVCVVELACHGAGGSDARIRADERVPGIGDGAKLQTPIASFRLKYSQVPGYKRVD